MFFAIDLDQTACTGYVGIGVPESIAYYRQRGITIPESATRYIDFFGLPDVMRVHEQIPGALAGVQKLAQLGNLSYFTVRKATDPDAQRSVQTATREWLVEHQFPLAAHVIFCRSMVHKLLAIAECQKEQNGPILLIDDSWRKALDALQFIEDQDKSIAQLLREQLTIAAFGVQPGDLPDAPVGLIALPDWSQIDRVISSFTPQKEISNGIGRNTGVSSSDY